MATRRPGDNPDAEEPASKADIWALVNALAPRRCLPPARRSVLPVRPSPSITKPGTKLPGGPNVGNVGDFKYRVGVMLKSEDWMTRDYTGIWMRQLAAQDNWPLRAFAQIPPLNNEVIQRVLPDSPSQQRLYQLAFSTIVSQMVVEQTTLGFDSVNDVAAVIATIFATCAERRSAANLFLRQKDKTDPDMTERYKQIVKITALCFGEECVSSIVENPKIVWDCLQRFDKLKIEEGPDRALCAALLSCVEVLPDSENLPIPGKQ